MHPDHIVTVSGRTITNTGISMRSILQQLLQIFALVEEA